MTKHHKTQIKEQIFEKKRMRSKIDLIDKWKRREEDLHAMIMKVPTKTLVFFFGNPHDT